MKKNNLKTIRLSDEMMDLIDRQIGNTFSEKFETLVTRCIWELPQKEQEIGRIDLRIQEKKRQLHGMTRKLHTLEEIINDLTSRSKVLQLSIEKSISRWDDM